MLVMSPENRIKDPTISDQTNHLLQIIIERLSENTKTNDHEIY